MQLPGINPPMPLVMLAQNPIPSAEEPATKATRIATNILGFDGGFAELKNSPVAQELSALRCHPEAFELIRVIGQRLILGIVDQQSFRRTVWVLSEWNISVDNALIRTRLIPLETLEALQNPIPGPASDEFNRLLSLLTGSLGIPDVLRNLNAEYISKPIINLRRANVELSQHEDLSADVSDVMTFLTMGLPQDLSTLSSDLVCDTINAISKIDNPIPELAVVVCRLVRRWQELGEIAPNKVFFPTGQHGIITRDHVINPVKSVAKFIAFRNGSLTQEQCLNYLRQTLFAYSPSFQM